MSAENVVLVRSLQPAPEVDLVELFADDGVAGQLAEVLASLLDPGFECGIYHPATPHVTYPGLDGLGACWRDWLAPWASYRTEIEELSDVGERVVVIARAEFYAGDRTEALAAVGLAEEPHPDRPDAGR